MEYVPSRWSVKERNTNHEEDEVGRGVRVIGAALLVTALWLCVGAFITLSAGDGKDDTESFWNGHTKLKIALVTLLWPVAVVVLMLGAVWVMAGEVRSAWRKLD